MSPTGRCSETAMTGCSVANATRQRLRGGSDSPPVTGITAGQRLRPGPATSPLPAPRPGHGDTRRGQPRLLRQGVPVAGGVCSVDGDHRSLDRQVLRSHRRFGDQPVTEDQRPSPARRIPHPHVEVETLSRIGVCVEPLQPEVGSAPTGCGVSCSTPGCRGKPAAARMGSSSSAVCRSGTVSCRSITFFAAIPGIAVDPM